MIPCDAPIAYAAMIMPSMMACGVPSSRLRSMKAPGSPSSALQTRYFGEPVGLAAEAPLDPGQEARAAAPAQAGLADLVDDLLRGHLRQGLGRRRVAVARDVVLEVDGVEDPVEAEHLTLLPAVERQIVVVRDPGAGDGILVEQPLDRLAVQHGPLEDLGHVLGSHAGAEHLLGKRHDDRPLLAEPVTAGGLHRHLAAAGRAGRSPARTTPGSPRRRRRRSRCRRRRSRPSPRDRAGRRAPHCHR